MTTIGTTRALRLRDVIVEGAGGPDHLDDYLTSNVLESRRVKLLLPTTRRSIDGQLHEAISAVLSRDVIGVLAAGWQASAELRAAARRTITTPAATEFVPFLTFTISQSIRPSVRLFVDRDVVMTVELDIVLQVRFHELTAAVRSGALEAIDFGQCTVIASVRTSTETPLVERTLTLSSNQRLDLPHPIVLTSTH
jgi:hypothetical protein